MRTVDSNGSHRIDAPDRPCIVGLISNTHGQIRPEALEALRHSDLIVHCGDVGDPSVLEALERMAPLLRAIHGNNDRGPWASALPCSDLVAIGSHSIYVLHKLDELDLDPVAAGITAVVSGHSHKPAIHQKGGILFVNPGSAGPRRFSLPITVARLAFHSAGCSADIIHLDVPQPPTKARESGR